MGLSRQVAIVAAGRVAATSSIFVVNAVLARAWTLPEFGHFSAVWILGNTLVPVFLCGLPTALLYAFPRCATGPARLALLRQGTWLLTAAATVLVVLLWLAGDLVAQWLSLPAAMDLIVPFLPYLFSLVAAGHVEAALVASGRSVWQAWLALAGALGLVAVAVAASVYGWDPAHTFAALSVVGVFRGLLGWGLLAAGPGGLGLPGSAGLGALVSYAARIGLNDAVGSLSRAVDRMVVLTFLGAADLALYHVGAIEVPVSLMLAAVVTVLVPEVSRLSAAGDTEAVAALFCNAVGRLALFILPLFCFLFAHADVVIDVYLPASYARTDQVFRIFLLALPLRCAVYNPILVGTGRANWALLGAVGDLGLNLSLSVLLVLALLPAHTELALLGPAAATVVATWCQVGVLVALLARTLGRSWRDVLPWGRLGRVVSAGTLAAVASMASLLLEDLAPIWRLALAAIVFMPVVAALLYSWHRPDWDELIATVTSLRRAPAIQERQPHAR